ncbi:hypothetical protein NDA11_002576 [Ustilago hordei]|nr:hypothetical protein NDA11_002576 [Ustilago hordei]
MSDINTFSTLVWVRNIKHGKSKSKLSQHGQKCFWVGVPDLSEAAHRCIDTEDYSKVYTLRDVKFDAETLSDAIINTNLDYISQARDPTDLKIKLAMVAHYLQEGSSNVRELESSLTNKPCMSPKEQVTAACDNIRSDLNMQNAAIEFVTTVGQDSLIMHNDPQTLMQAQKCTEWSSWEKAIKDKLDSLDDARTWIVTDLPENWKAIMAKWVFKTKHDADGNPVKYKAHLVAHRFNQMHGIDYHDMYSPVVSMTCLHLVICYSLKNKLQIWQIDFVTMYLNGELPDIDIYMTLPPGFEERYRRLSWAWMRRKQKGP